MKLHKKQDTVQRKIQIKTACPQIPTPAARWPLCGMFVAFFHCLWIYRCLKSSWNQTCICTLSVATMAKKAFLPLLSFFFPQESLWVCLIGIQFKATNNSLTVFFQGPGRCCTSAAQQQQQWAGMTAVTYNCVMRTFVNGWYGGSKNTRHGYVWNNVAQVASISHRSKEVSFSHQYLSRTESQEWQSVQSKVNIRSGVHDKQKYEKQVECSYCYLWQEYNDALLFKSAYL